MKNDINHLEEDEFDRCVEGAQKWVDQAKYEKDHVHADPNLGQDRLNEATRKHEEAEEARRKHRGEQKPKATDAMREAAC